MKQLLFLSCFCVAIASSFANDSLIGKWRGSIIGHVDDRDYFINADVKWVKDSVYSIELKLFSREYIGKFMLTTVRRNNNRLYITAFETLNEFPQAYLHIQDCFTGYFQYSKPEDKQAELDLYRNPIYRYTFTFRTKDSTGNLIPDFECFSSVLLHPANGNFNDTDLEKQTDSIISRKKNTFRDVSKRKVVSGKEWNVKKSKIIIHVWDNNKEDGDIISLRFNDTWLLTNFLLKKEKYTIELELTQKDNQLLLYAENLGSIPPNTAAISIDDDDLIRTFILNSDMTKSETIRIVLDKPKK